MAGEPGMLREFLTQHWPEGLIAAMTGLLTFFGRREIKRNDDWHKKHEARYDDHEDRIDELEADRVTRDDFDELRHSMMASFENMANRFETKVDSMHGENRDMLKLIHGQVLDLWKHRANGDPR